MSSASFTSKELIAVLTISGVAALNVFLTGALTVALPSIGKDLHFKQADLQWPINVYSLAYGCLLLFLGRVGDIIGPKHLFLAGTAWFSLWSLPSAFAPSSTVFICFMALIALGAAANTPASVALLSSMFEAGPKRDKAFAFLGAGQPLGFISGLVLGGVLANSSATWRAILYIQTGLGVMFCVLGWFYVDGLKLPPRYVKGLDWGGAFLCTAGVGLLTYSVADSATAAKGWASPHIIALLVTSIVLLTMFVFYERWREAKDKSVLMPMSIFSLNVSSLLLVTFFGLMNFNTLSYFITLYYQQVILLNPLITSVRFIAMAASGFTINVITGYALGYMSGFWPVIVGLVASAAAPLLFSLMKVNSSYWASTFLVQILVVGVDAFYVVGTIQIIASVPEDSQSLAGGMFNVAGRIGNSIGLAVSSTVANSISQKYYNSMSASEQAINGMESPKVLMIGYRAGGWMCFAAAVLALVIAALFTRHIERTANGEKSSTDAPSIATEVGTEDNEGKVSKAGSIVDDSILPPLTQRSTKTNDDAISLKENAT